MNENRRIILPNGKIITLNDQQQEALEDIIEWIKSPDEFLYTLKGYAGTGKTTISKEAIKEMGWGVVVSAPTHKAKNVISIATGRPSQTIQSLLGLQPNTDLENFDINNPQFDTRGEPKIQDTRYLIIDESSMLNNDLFTLIVDRAKLYKCKVLFMGDPAQLPPVNEIISKVFVSNNIDRMYELTKVERQADSNPLMLVYDKIRSNVDSSVDQFDHVNKVNKDTNEGIAFISDEEKFKNLIKFELDGREDINNPDEIKILAWTNKKVKYWNQYIRQSIYGEDVDYLIEGEFLMAYNNVGYGDSITVENSADYQVIDFSKWSDAVKSPKGEEVIVIEMYKTILRLYDTSEKITYNRIVNIVVPTMDNYRNFLRMHGFFLGYAKKAPYGKTRRDAWRAYYIFKDAHLLLHDLKDSKGKLIVKKDFDYSYAMTVHKSQGSTYKVVFLDENDVDYNKVDKERNNLKYVALSRPSKRAYCLSVNAGLTYEDLTRKPNKVQDIHINPAIYNNNNMINISLEDIEDVEIFKEQVKELLNKHKKKKLNVFTKKKD